MDQRQRGGEEREREKGQGGWGGERWWDRVIEERGDRREGRYWEKESRERHRKKEFNKKILATCYNNLYSNLVQLTIEWQVTIANY